MRLICKRLKFHIRCWALDRAYYGKDGIEYNIGRVNMGGCDFSTRLYTYDDVEGDEELTHFELAEEDTEYKVLVPTQILP